MDFLTAIPWVLAAISVFAAFFAQYRLGARREWRDLATVREEQNKLLKAEINELRDRVAYLEGKYAQLLELFEDGVADRVAEAVLEKLQTYEQGKR